MKRICWSWLFVFPVALASITVARADVTGVILGTVADPTGAVIVAAHLRYGIQIQGWRARPLPTKAGTTSFYKCRWARTT